MHWHFHGLFDRSVLNTGLSHLDPATLIDGWAFDSGFLSPGAPTAEVKGKKLELVDN